MKTVKRTVSPLWILSVRYVLLTIFHRNIVNFDNILIYNQHQKYDIFHVEHFSQNSKLNLDRAHRDYRDLVEWLTAIAALLLTRARQSRWARSRFNFEFWEKCSTWKISYFWCWLVVYKNITIIHYISMKNRR